MSDPDPAGLPWEVGLVGGLSSGPVDYWALLHSRNLYLGHLEIQGYLVSSQGTVTNGSRLVVSRVVVSSLLVLSMR